MMNRNYGPKVLDDLAALVASTRADTKPTWQLAGIRAALVAAGQRDGTITLPQLAYAATTVALDPTARTPQRIAHDGPWWTLERPLPAIRRIAHDDCSVCQQPRGQCLDDGHEYQPWSVNLGKPMPDHIRNHLADVAEQTHLAATAGTEPDPEPTDEPVQEPT